MREKKKEVRERELEERERMKDKAAQRVTVVPDASVTLNTASICEGTCAGMCSEALATVTHPRLTEVTYSSLEEDKQ